MTPLAADLVQLVDGDQRGVVQAGRHPGGVEQSAQHLAMVQRIVKSVKPRRVSTSLTAAHTSASTTGEVEPMASTSH